MIGYCFLWAFLKYVINQLVVLILTIQPYHGTAIVYSY